ncbi:hypothetical protein CCACVL1_22480, partial [Corchorus capsularis]
VVEVKDKDQRELTAVDESR